MNTKNKLAVIWRASANTEMRTLYKHAIRDLYKQLMDKDNPKKYLFVACNKENMADRIRVYEGIDCELTTTDPLMVDKLNNIRILMKTHCKDCSKFDKECFPEVSNMGDTTTKDSSEYEINYEELCKLKDNLIIAHDDIRKYVYTIREHLRQITSEYKEIFHLNEVMQLSKDENNIIIISVSQNRSPLVKVNTYNYMFHDVSNNLSNKSEVHVYLKDIDVICRMELASDSWIDFPREHHNNEVIERLKNPSFEHKNNNTYKKEELEYDERYQYHLTMLRKCGKQLMSKFQVSVDVIDIIGVYDQYYYKLDDHKHPDHFEVHGIDDIDVFTVDIVHKDQILKDIIRLWASEPDMFHVYLKKHNVIYAIRHNDVIQGRMSLFRDMCYKEIVRKLT